MTDSTVKLSPRKQQAVETRNKILKAAKDTFLENGFQKTTISQIIKKANTGYGTAYVYFKNKDELFMVLMEDLMDEFYKVAELDFKPASKEEASTLIQEQVRLFLTLAVEERSMMMIVKEAIGVSTDIDQKWYKIRERFISRISIDIQFAQKNSLANPLLDASLVARGWFYSNEMYMWELVSNETRYSMEEVIYNLTSIYTDGLYK